MATEKRVYTQGVTPKGQLVFPHIYAPEEYEGKDVGYSVQIKFGQKETDSLIAKIDEELEKAKSSIKLKPGQKWSSDPFLSYKEDKDGDIVFKFKTTSTFQTRTGEVVERKIPVFDAHGKPIKEILSIGNGTVAKVAYTIIPYWMSKAVNGIKLRLEAVQIIDLVEYGERKADSYGFASEEGFDADSITHTDTEDDGVVFVEGDEEEGDF